MKKTGGILLVCLLLAALAAAGWFWYDANVDRSGWDTSDQGKVYRDFYGDPVTGWQQIGEDRYYFGQDGGMRSGWLSLEEGRYWLDAQGRLQTGWQEIEGGRFYFCEDGTMAVQWQELEGTLYGFGTDGVLQTGWQERDGIRYFFDEQGAAVTGAVTLEGAQFFFREDGSMVTGWQEDRYYGPEGAMASGWTRIGDGTYYFDESGVMHTGWLEQGEYRYYLQTDGTMATGPLDIDGKTYHFSPHGVQIWLVNPWNYLHEDYTVELVGVDAGYRLAAVCEDAFHRMMEACRAAGFSPELISGYRTYWDQQAMYMDKIAEYGVASGSQIVAKPNTSEHQLGLAVDIVASGNYTLNKTQGETRVQKWLMENCWDYGFILRYPEGTTDITGIIYEPWHYRYVGLEIALELKELGITLEEYLGACSGE